MRAPLAALVAAAACAVSSAQRTVYSLDLNWRFQLASNPAPPTCNNPNTTFPIDMTGIECDGLTQVPYAASQQDCINACCAVDSCATWQWCPQGAPCNAPGTCWIGSRAQCNNAAGWVSRGRNVAPSASPSPAPSPAGCTDPGCQPGTNDSGWRQLDVPHDFAIEQEYVNDESLKSHGYLPGGAAWYRKHLTIPSSLKGATLWLDFDGVFILSTVYLNGVLLGSHASGYTTGRYAVPASAVNWDADNVLAVHANGDLSLSDAWWYDGNGIYRHVWLTAVQTPGPYLAPWGVYAPSNVSGPISWAGDGTPIADAVLMPSVEVWNNASSAAAQDFEVTLTVIDPAGAVAATLTGSGAAAGNSAVTMWSPAQPISLPAASLWHLVTPPAMPALYTLITQLTVGGVVVDSTNVTFGIRQTLWSNATGLWLNGVNTKILGTANHQDYTIVGAAVPDRVQWHRVGKLKQMGVNGWRTAHNPPTPALLDAADQLGMLVWDENHHNGQLDQIPLLVKRDRNHPSVIIWSICNEVLCDTNDWIADGIAAKELMHELDPLGGRPVSANQNGWIGTPVEDVIGFDYGTQNYDSNHAKAPWQPSISSETSSAVSDRDEYFNDGVGGHVSAFDTNAPGWGETAEGAWGGIGMPAGQGILTRSFIAGGWTWTGFDYRGEPTPYGWPDVSSHFGILDNVGFEKARFYWYRAWFVQPSPTPELYLFPHWNDLNVSSSSPLPIWVFSNAPFVELFVNGESAGRKAMPQYGHLEWDGVPWRAGNITAIAYSSASSSTPLATMTRATTSAPAALRVSVKDSFGSTLIAGCRDVALVQVEVVDSNGLLVPTASNNVTYSIAGPAQLKGTGNGDPACVIPTTELSRPVNHGLALGVVQAGDATGSVTVTVTSPGLQSGSVTIPVQAAPGGWSAPWCVTSPRL